jgi:hypothetical protein
MKVRASSSTHQVLCFAGSPPRLSVGAVTEEVDGFKTCRRRLNTGRLYHVDSLLMAVNPACEGQLPVDGQVVWRWSLNEQISVILPDKNIMRFVRIFAS